MKTVYAIYKQIAQTGEKIYYERRSRQYSRDANIKQTQIADLKMLTQSFVSVFMQAPHNGTSHEAILLKKYRNSIFVDGQSLYPYFIAMLMCLNFEHARRNGKINRDIENYKYHILLISSELIAGICPAINNSAEIDKYCNKLVSTITHENKYAEVISQSDQILQGVIKEWIGKFGPKYRYGIKDNANFTNFMLIHIRGGNTDNFENSSIPPLVLRGRVVKAKLDKNGLFYGFIQRSPDDVFFHERDNTKLDFNEIYGKTVLYRVFADDRTGDDRAEIIEVLNDIY